MPDRATTNSETLTERQKKWFASVREGLERDTGKSLDAWVKIARKCPETKHKARLAWLKDNHGLGVNRASTVLSEAFREGPGWSDPEALIDALWKDAALRDIYEKLDAAAMNLDGVTRGPRKGYTAFSREFQFAAARPYKGAVRFGLALDPETDQRLETAKANEGWSERLKSSVMLGRAGAVDAELKKLIKQAWRAS